MAVINTGLAETAIRGEFFNRYDSTQTHWKNLSTRIVSTGNEEKYRFLGTVPQLREWGSGRLARGLNAESYNVENQKYELTIEVDRDEMDDDQLAQIRMRINEMAEAAATHKDYLLEQLLINGESAGFHSHDGVPFFNEAHVSGASGEQSNLLTADAVNPDDPTEAEFRKAITAAIAKMVGYKDDQGNARRIMPNPPGFVCVVPPTMMFTAMSALSIQFVPNATQVMEPNVVQGAARVVALPGLTDASKWYLLKTDVSLRPFIFQDRMPVEFKALETNSETGFMREAFLYGVRARYAMAYGYWYYAIRTDFETSE